MDSKGRWIKKYNPANWSNKDRLRFSIGLTLLYCVLFFILLPIIGPSITALSVLIVAFTAWFIGLKVALLQSTFLVIYSMVAFELSGTVRVLETLSGGGLIGFTVLYISAIIIGLSRRVTRKANQEIVLRKQLFQLVPSAIFTVDTNRRITSLNQKTIDILGYEREELIGKHCNEFALEPCQSTCSLLSNPELAPLSDIECKVRTKDGKTLFVSKNADLIRDDNGNLIGGIESFIDITERKLAEETLHHLATHDKLTGLPNRTHFEEILNRSLRLAERSEEQLAVFFIDLDGFKAVNDTHGHATGDQLLVRVGEIFNQTVRASDLVGRMGGDEFAVMLHYVDDQVSIIQAAQRLILNISQPIEIEGKLVSISCSIGISTYPQDGSTSDILLRRADMAMYAAKNDGKGKYTFFDESMKDK